MLNKLLKIEGITVLDKKQQYTVIAGTCSIFVRMEDGTSFWSAQTYSVNRAQEYFATDGDMLHGGFSVTGYCCASCNTYQNHPSYNQ